jgi:hypothetical protein
MRNTKGKEAKRSYSRHGLTPLRQKVKIRGIDAIAWRREPIDHLGGNPMAAQIALIDLACRSKLLLEHLDACLLEQGSLVNKRSREVLPWERLRFAEGLTPGRDSAKTTSMSALFLLAALLFM